jgi:hypothetical protein
MHNSTLYLRMRALISAYMATILELISSAFTCVSLRLQIPREGYVY